jgi:hypothetical protein
MMGEMLQQIGRLLLPIICGMNSASEPLNPQMGLFTRGKSTVDESDTLIDTRTQSEEDLEAGDHERFAHYVRKEKIVESAVSGKPVTALCGKRWIPSRDPNKFPICPTCKEIHAGLRKGPDDGSKQS